VSGTRQVTRFSSGVNLIPIGVEHFGGEAHMVDESVPWRAPLRRTAEAISFFAIGLCPSMPPERSTRPRAHDVAICLLLRGELTEKRRRFPRLPAAYDGLQGVDLVEIHLEFGDSVLPRHPGYRSESKARPLALVEDFFHVALHFEAVALRHVGLHFDRGADKTAAGEGRWRTPPRSLRSLSEASRAVARMCLRFIRKVAQPFTPLCAIPVTEINFEGTR